jgi:hypothetical protein
MHKWYHCCSDCAIPKGEGTAAATAGFGLVLVEQPDHVPLAEYEDAEKPKHLYIKSTGTTKVRCFDTPLYVLWVLLVSKDSVCIISSKIPFCLCLISCLGIHTNLV